jgi:hypothetical protein
MPTQTRLDLAALADECVADMGDIFWDYDERRDADGDHTDPRTVAVAAVRAALARVEQAQSVATSDREVRLAVLRREYAQLLAALPEQATDRMIVEALVVKADWTRAGGRTVLALAQRYGTFVLRNALALADAMEIEDGSAGH